MEGLNPLTKGYVLNFFNDKSIKFGKGIVSMEREETVLRENFPLDALYIPSRGFTELRVETIHGELIFRPLLSPMLEWFLNYQFKHDYGIPMYAVVGNTTYVYVIDNLTTFGDAVYIYREIKDKSDIDRIVEQIVENHMPWINERHTHNHVKDQVLEVIRITNKS